ncbi:MAG TPA: hypothetical protein VFR21_10040, partial [Bradyrhizobium sp.]|nr:hypothetical protein [Bradyrhizobium sp.]
TIVKREGLFAIAKQVQHGLRMKLEDIDTEIAVGAALPRVLRQWHLAPVLPDESIIRQNLISVFP